jgi:hypothetical protein
VREIYDYTTKCWPAASWLRAEISLEGRKTNSAADTITSINTDGSSTREAKTYAAIVAKIPLYSAIELDKEREREAKRNETIATNIGKLSDALFKYHVATRALSLRKALENRSKARVNIGVAETAEQITALKEVEDWMNKKITAEADIYSARLVLVGHCQSDKVQGLDEMLDDFIEGGKRGKIQAH